MTLYDVLYVEHMPDEKIERCIDFEFLVKLGKSATESFRFLTDVYGNAVYVTIACFRVAQTIY